MSNITTYIKWRGDLSFEERPFCSVDNLIFSVLSYIPLHEIVPEVGSKQSISIEHALNLFLNSEERRNSISLEQLKFTEALVHSKRFSGLRLRNYRDLANIEGTQTDFSAMEICLSDTVVYTAFRGTGDAILGWREDFSMCFQLMPAQRIALQYLEKTYDPDIREYIFGGHSKGGNIALYAAACCKEEQQKKIRTIYSNDGPGLCEDVIAPEKVAAVKDRLIRIVPEFSIIGALFKTDAETVIVKSSVSGILEHDALTWQVEGDAFETVSEHSKECMFYNDVLHTWIESADMEQRENFTRDFFDALEANGAETLTDVSGNGVDDFLVILMSLTQSDRNTRNVILRFGQVFFSALRHTPLDVLVKEKEMIYAVVCIVAGIVISMFPDYAVTFAGMAAGIGGSIYIGKRILDTAFGNKGTIEAKKMKTVVLLISMCVLMYLIADQTLLMRISNIVIGAAFLLFAYYWLNRSFRYRKIVPNRIIGILISIVFFTAGMLPMMMNGIAMTEYMVAVGGLIWFYGIGIIVHAAYKNGKKVIDEQYYRSDE